LVRTLERFADEALSMVGRAYGILPADLADRCYLAWLVEEFKRIQRDEFDAQIAQIQAVEIGVSRTVGAAFGAKLKPLPKWEDVVEARKAEEEPEWMKKYKTANRLQS
jgi:hypothetical protein